MVDCRQTESHLCKIELLPNVVSAWHGSEQSYWSCIPAHLETVFSVHRQVLRQPKGPDGSKGFAQRTPVDGQTNSSPSSMSVSSSQNSSPLLRGSPGADKLAGRDAGSNGGGGEKSQEL